MKTYLSKTFSILFFIGLHQHFQVKRCDLCKCERYFPIIESKFFIVATSTGFYQNIITKYTENAPYNLQLLQRGNR